MFCHVFHDLGQFDLGQLAQIVVCMCLLCVLVQDLRDPPHPPAPPPDPPSAGPPLRQTAPPPDRPLRRTAQNFALFFPSPTPIFIFFSLQVSSRVFFPLSGGLLVEFWWCFGRSGPQMCLFSPSGCPVKPRRPDPSLVLSCIRATSGYDLLRPVLHRPSPT